MINRTAPSRRDLRSGHGVFAGGFEFDRITQKNQYAGVAMSTFVESRRPFGESSDWLQRSSALRKSPALGKERIEPSIDRSNNGCVDRNGQETTEPTRPASIAAT
jgi:hypothetical protein